jgi:alginate O-acetyltransferase complex protein AlgI
MSSAILPGERMSVSIRFPPMKYMAHWALKVTSPKKPLSARTVRTPLVGQALLLIALIWLVIQVKSSDIQPFIYFQF